MHTKNIVFDVSMSRFDVIAYDVSIRMYDTIAAPGRNFHQTKKPELYFEIQNGWQLDFRISSSCKMTMAMAASAAKNKVE